MLILLPSEVLLLVSKGNILMSQKGNGSTTPSLMSFTSKHDSLVWDTRAGNRKECYMDDENRS